MKQSCCKSVLNSLLYLYHRSGHKSVINEVRLPSLAKGLAFFGISESRRKNQKIISSNDENAFFFQSKNYDVFDIDEMLIIF